jgi:hypothetical protein
MTGKTKFEHTRIGGAFIFILAFLIVGSIGLFVLAWPVLMLAIIGGGARGMPEWLRIMVIAFPWVIIAYTVIRVLFYIFRNAFKPKSAIRF